jgi:cytochrome P450
MAMSPGLRAASVFTASDKQFHRTRRRLIGRILTEKSLGTFEPKMAEQMDVFLKNLLASTTEGPSPGPVNMTDRARRLTTNVAGLLGFGYDLGLQTDDKNDFMLTIFDVAAPKSSLYYHFYSIRPWIRWLSIMFFLRIRERFMGLVDTLVTSRMKKDKDAIHDLYSVVADVLDTNTESGSLRQSDLWAEAFFFLTAGK